jgi:oxygen-independent coproporphyrinogen-3 oxidase
MNGFAPDALGIYISIPFCKSKCTYCNFASGVYPASEHARYVDRVVADLRGAGVWAGRMGVELPHRVDTIYLGGGTPSLLAPELIAKLFAAIRAEFDLDAQAEITVECAPAQLADATLEALAAAGVNRASLGVQSFIDSEAQASGRLHNRAAVERDMARLRAAGIRNLNVDLIAGLAGQTMETWLQSLEALAACQAPHASIYMLEVDEDSRLGRELLAGGKRYRAGLVPSDELIAEMYEAAIEKLGAAGIKQYEISNFCREGFASRHNLRYWERRPYLGVGVDASSMLRALAAETNPGEMRAVLRSTTTDNLADYIDGAPTAETAWFSALQQQEEAWFLGLRLNRGVEIAAMEQEFGAAAVAPALAVASRLIDEGLMDGDRRTVRLTNRGRLLSNEVFAQFLGLGSAAHPA